MKDKITLNKFIWTIVGFLLLFFIIVPIGETLIYQSRYKNPSKDLVQVQNDDFDMYINDFTSSGRDGFVDVDIIKKSDKWKYAEVQVIDKDGYVIHREYVDLSDVNVGDKVNAKFSFKGEDASHLNIVGSDEIKEPNTVLNNLKNKLKDTALYKELENFYNTYLKDVFKVNFDEFKLKIQAIPGWLRITLTQLMETFMTLHPGLRGIILIATAMLFI